MDVDDIDLDMGDDSLYGGHSPTSSLAVQQWIDESHESMAKPFTQTTARGLSPEATSPDNALTAHLPGEQAAQTNTTPKTPRFDPTALLNPKSVSKRPASSSEPSVDSRSETASASQVSLVERLHNVQERAASPAKRVKTTEEQQRKKKSSNGSHFGGSSSLDLNSNSGSASVPQQVQYDLTMSMHVTVCTEVIC